MATGHGWGVLKLFSLISPLSRLTKFYVCSNHIYIWQVTPQLRCGNTCQIWMWYSAGKQCFEKISNAENWLSNPPHPREVPYMGRGDGCSLLNHTLWIHMGMTLTWGWPWHLAQKSERGQSYWGLNQTAIVFQTAIWNALSGKKSFGFRFRFNYS